MTMGERCKCDLLGVLLTHKTLVGIRTNAEEYGPGEFVCANQPLLFPMLILGTWESRGPWSHPSTFRKATIMCLFGYLHENHIQPTMVYIFGQVNNGHGNPP